MNSMNKYLKGQLKRWNDDRGFGFVNSENEKGDIFLHISVLKNMSRRPVVGDVILYQIHTEDDGKKRAVNARIEGVALVKQRVRRKSTKTYRKTSWVFQLITIVSILFIGYAIYKVVAEKPNSSATLTPFSTSSPKRAEYKSNFSCKGKTYCSEMSSCEEAKFYQHNCPGTKMDGDGDGIPCESQWCG